MSVEERIAVDQMAYLRDNPDVCAEGSVTGWMWVCFSSGDWIAEKNMPGHTPDCEVEVLHDRETVVSWFEANPVEMIPVTDAGGFLKRGNVWLRACEQGVMPSEVGE